MNESHCFINSLYLIKNIFVLSSLCSTAYDVSSTLGISDPRPYKYSSLKFDK